MNIQAISDTHGSNFISKIDKCDILLIAGDISPVKGDHSYYNQKYWYENEFVKQLEELKSLANHIVFIGGNHDTYLSECNISKNNNAIRSILPSNVHYLCDDLVTIDEIKIYGSPWCNRPSWARKGPPVWNFALNEFELKEHYDKIPNDIDILLTHGPAYGYCDSILDESITLIGDTDKRLGSTALSGRIRDGLKAKYVLSGHIHSAERNYVIYKQQLDEEGIKHACVSILNEQYNFSDACKPLKINY